MAGRCPSPCSLVAPSPGVSSLDALIYSHAALCHLIHLLTIVVADGAKVGSPRFARGARTYSASTPFCCRASSACRSCPCGFWLLFLFCFVCMLPALVIKVTSNSSVRSLVLRFLVLGAYTPIPIYMLYMLLYACGMLCMRGGGSGSGLASRISYILSVVWPALCCFF